MECSFILAILNYRSQFVHPLLEEGNTRLLHFYVMSKSNSAPYSSKVPIEGKRSVGSWLIDARRGHEGLSDKFSS